MTSAWRTSGSRSRGRRALRRRAAPAVRRPRPSCIAGINATWLTSPGGHSYGTILVNLVNHRVVDLLPDRAAASVAAWLTAHPTITVISRDRSALYAEGIRQGAPQAIQVVDRFHLVANLREAVEAFLGTQRPALLAAAVRTAQALAAAAAPVPVPPMDRRQTPNY